MNMCSTMMYIYEHSEQQDRIEGDDEQREISRREIRQLRLRISDLENARAELEKEIAATRANTDGEEEKAKQRIVALTDALDDVRARERRLEEQRHNLELTLASSQAEINELTVRLTGCEGRLSEMHGLVERLEGGKKDLEVKLANVSAILRDARSRSRPATPTRTRSRGADSPWRASASSMSQVDGNGGGGNGLIDLDTVRNGVRDIVGRATAAEKERDDIREELSTSQRLNDDLSLRNASLEQKLSKQKERMAGSEEQLRKLEQKVSLSDITLANQDEELLRRERDVREISSRLDSSSKQLEEMRRRGSSSEEESARSLREVEKRAGEERRRAREAAKEAESQVGRLEAQKKGLAAEQVRLQTMIAERDAEIKVRIFKRNIFRSGTRHYPISFIRIICLPPRISCISKSALACSLE